MLLVEHRPYQRSASLARVNESIHCHNLMRLVNRRLWHRAVVPPPPHTMPPTLRSPPPPTSPPSTLSPSPLTTTMSRLSSLPRMLAFTLRATTPTAAATSSIARRPALSRRPASIVVSSRRASLRSPRLVHLYLHHSRLASPAPVPPRSSRRAVRRQSSSHRRVRWPQSHANASPSTTTTSSTALAAHHHHCRQTT
jgi:hypothetical protein